MATKRSRVFYTVTFTLHDASTIVCKDTAEARNGRAALDKFLEQSTAKCVTDDPKTYYVPFHAVIKVEVTTAVDESDTYDDPVCAAPVI